MDFPEWRKCDDELQQNIDRVTVTVAKRNLDTNTILNTHTQEGTYVQAPRPSAPLEEDLFPNNYDYPTPMQVGVNSEFFVPTRKDVNVNTDDRQRITYHNDDDDEDDDDDDENISVQAVFNQPSLTLPSRSPSSDSVLYDYQLDRRRRFIHGPYSDVSESFEDKTYSESSFPFPQTQQQLQQQQLQQSLQEQRILSTRTQHHEEDEEDIHYQSRCRQRKKGNHTGTTSVRSNIFYQKKKKKEEVEEEKRIEVYTDGENRHSRERTTTLTKFISGHSQEEEEEEDSTLVAAGIAGAVVGTLVLGTIPGVICGFYVAYVHKDDGAAGDISRALGEIAVITRQKAITINAKHHVMSRTKQLLWEGWKIACSLNRQHRIIHRLKQFSSFAWTVTIEHIQRKHHKVIHGNTVGMDYRNSSSFSEQRSQRPALRTVSSSSTQSVQRNFCNSYPRHSNTSNRSRSQDNESMLLEFSASIPATYY